MDLNIPSSGLSFIIRYSGLTFICPEVRGKISRRPLRLLPVAAPQPYSKEELHDYLLYCRRKCQTIFANLTDKKANRSCKFPWGEAVSFAELQRYNMRHVQDHASQLSLHLGPEAGSALDWVARAGDTAV